MEDIKTAEDAALADLLKQRQAEVFALASELARRGYNVNANHDDHRSHDRYYPAREYRVTVSKTETHTTYL